MSGTETNESRHTKIVTETPDDLHMQYMQLPLFRVTKGHSAQDGTWAVYVIRLLPKVDKQFPVRVVYAGDEESEADEYFSWYSRAINLFNEMMDDIVHLLRYNVACETSRATSEKPSNAKEKATDEEGDETPRRDGR